MYWILGISLFLNGSFILIWFLNKEHLRRTISHLKKILSGQSYSLLKQSGQMKQQDVLIKEINGLIETLNETTMRYERIMDQNKQMVSSISHDFRTPLTSMLGYIQILKDKSTEANEERYLAIVEERTRMLSNLVEEFYTLSILDSNEYNTNVECVNPILLVQEQVALYYNELDRTFDSVEINIEEEKVFIESSPVDLKRIVDNLIKNAFTHGVHFFKIDTIKADKSLKFVFENKVREPELIDSNRLFERLYRVDQTRKSGSTGLGLSIAQLLAQRLGLELSVELRGETLIFSLSVPLHESMISKKINKDD